MPAGGISRRGWRKITMKIINRNGYELDYDAAVNMMDDEIREELHAELAPFAALVLDIYEYVVHLLCTY